MAEQSFTTMYYYNTIVFTCKFFYIPISPLFLNIAYFLTLLYTSYKIIYKILKSSDLKLL